MYDVSHTQQYLGQLQQGCYDMCVATTIKQAHWTRAGFYNNVYLCVEKFYENMTIYILEH